MLCLIDLGCPIIIYELSDDHDDLSMNGGHTDEPCCRLLPNRHLQFSTRIMAFEIPNDGDFYLGMPCKRSVMAINACPNSHLNFTYL